jgi:hypothetical protein
LSLYNIHHGSESKICGNKVETYNLKAQITLEEYGFFNLTFSRLYSCQTTQYSRLSRLPMLTKVR